MNIHNAIRRLTGVSTAPESDVKHLLAYVLEMPVGSLLWHDVRLSVTQERLFEACMMRRLAGEPVAYIIGCWDFMGLELALNADTLIPRPETEELVDLVLGCGSMDHTKSLKVLDMGTGSGAIAIALAKQRTCWQLTAIDKVQGALNMAIQNAQRHHVASQIQFACVDWHNWQPCISFDVVVANPPYIAWGDQDVLQDVAQFEPQDALYAAENGFADCYAILDNISAYLVKGGHIFMEHGWQQSDRLKDYAMGCGYSDVVSVLDVTGKKRFLVARYGS